MAPQNRLNPDGPAKDLKRRSIRGGAITGSGQVAIFVLRFGSTAILARLLTPEDFGLVAMTVVIVGFAGIFKDAGLTSATIQRDHITHEQISTLFWINLALGCLLALGLVGVSGGIARFYGEPRLAGIMCALAATFVLGGLTVQHQALLRRQMRFSMLTMLDIGSTAFGVGTAVFMARSGWGYWSLVGMAVGSAACNLIAVWAAVPWRPGLPKRHVGIRPMLSFGSDVLSFNVVNYFARQADNLLIGWYWGPTLLGLYDKAYSLAMMPINQINSPLAAVAVPVLSRTNANASRFSSLFVGAMKLLGGVTIPLVVGIAIFADEVVLLWLGSAWMPTADLFRLLAVAAVIRAITNPVGWILLSLGQTRKYRQLGVINSVVIVMSFVIGLPWGATGVAASYSVAMALLLYPTWWFALRDSPVSLLAVYRALAPPFIACIPAAAVAVYISKVALAWSPHWLGTILGAIAFGSVYAVVLLVWFGYAALYRTIVKELRSVPAKRDGPVHDTAAVVTEAQV